MSYLEHSLNMSHFPASETFDSFFDAEIELCSVTGHNKHKDSKEEVVEELIEYTANPGKGFQKLGRWSSYILQGQGNSKHRTRVISAHCVLKNAQEGWGRVYQQHLRLITANNWATTPCNLFCDDLIRQIKIWKSQGEIDCY